MSARRSAWHAPKPPAIVEAVVAVDLVPWDVAESIESESLGSATIDAEAVGREIARGWSDVESPAEHAALERLHDSIRKQIAVALECARLLGENPHITAAQSVDAVASAYQTDRRVVTRAFKYWPAAAPTRFPQLLDDYRVAIARR